MEPHTELLSDIYRYLEAHGMARTTFGRQAVNDFSLVSDLERGRDIKVSTEKRIRRFISQSSKQRPSPEAR